jgi:tetratricopeptide (TPR) repeat protein
MDEESSSPAELPLQSTWEIEQALVALAETKPLALLLEDVHLCDRDELKMLGALASTLTSTPICLAMTYRTSDPAASDSTDGLPSGYYDLAAAPEIERLDLEPLGDRAIRTLLEQAAGLTALPLQLVERVIRDADGVPLYALELYRHLEASGEIERGQDSVRITERWGQAELPRPLRDMVQRRLAGIGDEERALLETAAVAGVEFDGARLAEVMDLPLLGVLRTLQRLYRERALVQPLKQGYRFGHALYQEAIYKDTAPDLRRALHRAWAEVLERGSTAAAVDPETLGWHWEQAGDPARASPYLRRAAAAAAGRSEHARAWRLAERAGILAPDASPEQIRRDFDVLVGLASTFATAADAERSEALYARLGAAAEALGDETMARAVLVAEAWHHVQRQSGRPLDVEALEDAAAHLPVGGQQADAWWLIGRARAGTGEYARAREAITKANEIYAEHRSGSPQAQLSQDTLAKILREECDFDAAREVFERLADALVSRVGKTPQAAVARAEAILCGALAGEAEGAAEALDEPMRWLERAGHAPRAAHTRVFQAELFEAEGRTADARASIRRAEPVLRDAVLGSSLWALCRAKARLQILAGELEAADASIAEAAGVAGNLGPIDLAHLDQQRAFLGTVRGEHEGAARLLVAALAQVAPTPHRKDMSILLVEMIQLAVLGLDLSAALPTLREVAREEKRPPVIDLALRIASVVFRDDLGELDAPALERAATAARDPRIGWHQAEMGVVASLLSARANVLSGEPEAAASLLREARQRAQHLEHVWLELCALQMARDADLDVDPFRVRALVDLLKERNPADPDRTATVTAAWTSGMPRA